MWCGDGESSPPSSGPPAPDHPLPRRTRRRRDTVLPCARLCDDTLLAPALCKQRLSERVVDFVGTRMQKVFAFQIDIRFAVVLRQPLGKV